MESKVAALEVEVENLKDWADKHERNDERTHKYMTNMMEDWLAKLSSLERSAARFEADLAQRSGNDLTTASSLEKLKVRLLRIELALATALGGIAVIAWLINHVSDSILRLLAR